MPRLRRFLHLERPRTTAEVTPPSSAATGGRFGGVSAPEEGAPAAPSASGAELGRFGPEPEPRLELDATAAGERPFTRCVSCATDHHVSAAECSSCGASLVTDEQREFNERLWAGRQEEAAREAAAAAARREQVARDAAELSASQRAMAEELAREVARRERNRLGADRGGWGLGGGWGGGGESHAPLGLRLLNALPDWRWQLGAIACAFALVGGLAAYGLGGRPGALFAAIIVTIVLVVPGFRIQRW